MATVNYSFAPEAGYTGIYRIKVYKLSTGLEIASEDKASPHANPVTGSIVVVSVEPYIVRVFAVGCDNKQVGMDIVYPPNGSCSPPTDLATTAVGTTTAALEWTAPGSPPASYDWYLFKKVGGSLVAVSNGNTTDTNKSFTGLVKNTDYRFLIVSNCDVDGVSSEVSLDFTTTGPETDGTVELAGGDDVIVTVRSTTNLKEYGIDGEEGARELPFDEYEIISFKAPCDEATITPDLFDTFIIDADNDTFNIEVNCPA